MGRNQMHEIHLSSEERELLIKQAKVGDLSPREILRAQILLKADKNAKGQSDQEIANDVHCSHCTVANLRKRFNKERLDVLHDRTRSGRPKIMDGDVEAHVIATVCSEPPLGRERWTMQLIADRVVQLTDLESCSEFTVRQNENARFLI